MTRFLLKITGPVAFWLSWPLSYLYVRYSERTRVVVVADDMILLVRAWHGPGNWSLPGGGLHKGESALAAAVREVREETGLVIEGGELKDLGLKVFGYSGLVFTCRYYGVTLPAVSRLKPGMPEILEAKWVKRSELNGFRLMPDVRQGLRSWRQPKMVG